MSPLFNPPAFDWGGDGSDGDVVISIDTVLTRPMYYRNLTIDAGKTLTTTGFPVYVSQRAQINGALAADGAAASTANPAQQTLGVGKGGGAGTAGDGGAGNVAGASWGGAGGNGAAGGGIGGNAGPGGAANRPADAWLQPRSMGIVAMGQIFAAALTLSGFSGGAGGGGGGGNNAGGAGGTGGQGGHVLIFAGKFISVGAGGRISANGGAGGGAAANNASGGGGGGGGVALVACQSYSGAPPTANPGAGGVAAGIGGTNGVAGVAGLATVFMV